MAGRLYRMAKVVSANPASWGIVDANQISGFRTVAKLTDLYSIAACVLSSSYGDGTTTGSDAVGQIWHVQESNEDYRLINWAGRGKAAGWEKVPTADEILTVVSDEITPILEELKEKDETFKNNLNSVTSDLNSFKTDSDAKFESLNLWSGAVADKLNTFGLPSGFATLDTKGFVPLSQLGNLDITVFTVVSVLPTSNIENKVYLLSNGTSGDNKYEEYIYTGDRSGTYDATKWERLGSIKASVDMTNYYTKTETTEQIKLWRVSQVYIGKENDHSTNLQFYVFDKQGHGVGKIIPVVTSELNGLMSPTMLTKLNGIADGATRNAVVNKVESTGTDAVSGKAVYDAINTHKLTNSNLSSTAIGNTYSILGECDSETNEVGALVDSLTYQYSADHSTLSIDGAAVWDESTLRAISNDELTKILI